MTAVPTSCWKLNHYYERLDDWNAAHGITANSFTGPAAEAVFEMHNLTADPEERHNRVGDADRELSRMTVILEAQGTEAPRAVPSQP